MRQLNDHCFYCRTDPPGSWERIVKSAKDAQRSWVCEDSDSSFSVVKTVCCLSNGHHNRPENCETEGQVLLSMMRNESRDFLGVAVEYVATPKTLIPAERKCFVKILPPISMNFFTTGLLKSDKGICVDETPITPPHEACSMQIKMLVLRDPSVGHQKIADLEKTGDWTLTGRKDVGRLTVEAV